MKRKLSLLLAALLALTMVMGTSVFAFSETLADNPMSSYYSEISEGNTMANNYGKVERNRGTVENNETPTGGSEIDGYIGLNFGTVVSNNGEVGRNEEGGTVECNNKKIVENYGTVEDNTNGEIGTNYSSIDVLHGKINWNSASIGTVDSDGFIDRNSNVTVGENKGQIENNFGSVDTNNGYVKNNARGIDVNNASVYINNETGTIVKNSATGEIFGNLGNIDCNEGTVSMNACMITENAGVVEQNGTFVFNNDKNGTVTNVEYDGGVDISEIFINQGTVNGIGRIDYNIDDAEAGDNVNVLKQMWNVVTNVWNKIFVEDNSFTTVQETQFDGCDNSSDVLFLYDEEGNINDSWLYEEGYMIVGSSDENNPITSLVADKGSSVVIEDLGNGFWKISNISDKIKITPTFSKDKPVPGPTPDPDPTPDPTPKKAESSEYAPSLVAFFVPTQIIPDDFEALKIDIVEKQGKVAGEILKVNNKTTIKSFKDYAKLIGVEDVDNKFIILTSSKVKNIGPAIIGLGKKIKLTSEDKIYAIIYDNIAKVTTKVDAIVNADGTVSVEVPSTDCMISLFRY